MKREGSKVLFGHPLLFKNLNSFTRKATIFIVFEQEFKKFETCIIFIL
jgi:hypothetical protein